MGLKLIFNISYGGETKLVSVDVNTSYGEVVGQITAQWPELEGTQICVHCAVGGLSNICLGSQDDLNSVRLICDVSSVRIVAVLLECTSSMGSESHGLECEDENTNFENIAVNGWHFGAVRKAGKVNIGHLREAKRKDVVYSNKMPTKLRCEGEEEDGSNLNSELCNRGQPLLSDGWEKLLMVGNGAVLCGSAADFRVALVKFATKIGFKFKFVRNAPDLIHVMCCRDVEPKCDWFIKARLDMITGSFIVEASTKPHECIHNLMNSMDAGMMSAKIIGDLMIPYAKNNARLNPKDVINAMMTGYGIDVTYSKARQAAECVKLKVYGDFYESYDQLKYYCHALKMMNPGSVVALEYSDDSNRFQRLFISLYASIKGFEFCPPLLFVDGTFLRGPFRGILLVAIAKDGNKGLFPIAYGVVSAEKTSNWSWFLRKIRDSISHPKRISYLSDRNTGLMAAFKEAFEEPVHYFCVYHLLANLKAKFCTGMKKRQKYIYIKLFKECAYEPDPMKFESKLQEFRIMGGKKADEWLSELPYHKWAISFSPNITRYGELTSNAAESFNAWILPARSLPITKMVDYIRLGMSKWYVKRRNESKNWAGLLVPKKEELWNTLSRIGIIWQVVLCPRNDYEVLSLPTTRVDLMSRSCSCHEWQSSGFPCCHAVAVIRKARVDLIADVEPFFLTTNYRGSYSWDINPVPETLVNELQSSPSFPKILSPILSRPIGRPKLKKRIPSIGEFKKKNKQKAVCRKCGQLASHDEWTCAG